MQRKPDRSSLWSSLDGDFDVLVIGGGATGLGVAVDAATRGYRTALVEAGDFAQATSSRATKLVHGGVRYLQSCQIHLVREALEERSILLRAAPHLVRRQAFVVPVYRRWQLPYYGAGLLVYNLLAGRASLGPTRVIGPAVAEQAPGIARTGLKGGVVYYDAQFNDARLALSLARTALDHGATAMNYVRCERLIHEGGRVRGAVVRDAESGATATVRARATINATGIFSDELRKLDDPGAAPMLALSRGTHIVVGSGSLGGQVAIIVPKTRDGRVIFAIPWEGRVLIGTTDVAAPAPAVEPGYSEEEVDYLLEQIGPYLERPIGKSDILSVFSGLRPLVSGKAAKTSQLSREHRLSCSAAGLITIAGGKWTTYRRMAEDTLEFAIRRGMLQAVPCVTRTLKIHGAAEGCGEYGSDESEVETLIAAEGGLAGKIDPALPYTWAQVVYAVRSEMARTVEDVLARRTRALLLDAQAAMRCAAEVAAVMAREMGRDAAWEKAQVWEFTDTARRFYLLR
ncbi:MAG TPA: glycerol-3-phosphate dehydrogenase/oxidase [Acidobacteriaceae bacterium]|jgi:glycerol-3-phosphate dehydrogenase|nr:glycerol-3-phosphate dehydrogenase/oxidase [Acidobacteriaceae bacterium]